MGAVSEQNLPQLSSILSEKQSTIQTTSTTVIGTSTVLVAGYLQTDGVFTAYVAGQSSIDAALSAQSSDKAKSELAAAAVIGAAAATPTFQETKPTEPPVKPEEPPKPEEPAKPEEQKPLTGFTTLP